MTPDLYLKESEINRVAWKRFRPALLGKDALQPAELPAAFAVCSRVMALRAGLRSADAAAFETFLLL